MNQFNRPLISVVMPVYNSEQFLKQAIDSILQQTYSNFEFIIIDDGSQDNSLDLIRSYSDSRIRLYQNKENIRIAACLNKGIQMSTGKYIAVMHSDDISLPDRLEKQLNFMESNPLVAACGAWVRTFGQINQYWKYAINHEDIRCLLLFDSDLAHPTVMFRRSMISEFQGPYNEAYRAAEDYELWVRISEKHFLANIGEVLLKYRFHENNNGIKNESQQKKEIIEIRKRQLDVLGLDLSEHNIVLHNRIAKYCLEYSLDFLREAEDWLLNILRANSCKCIYKEDVLKRILGRRWFNLCSHASPLGWQVFNIFNQSELSHFVRPNLRDYIKFVIKCLIAYGKRK